MNPYSGQSIRAFIPVLCCSRLAEGGAAARVQCQAHYKMENTGQMYGRTEKEISFQGGISEFQVDRKKPYVAARHFGFKAGQFLTFPAP
ncbi:hypothetical protein TNCV_2846401 [Trichonephila clavipes]|nr:hypothetical protein TNCV_2846401 [Trichonephila clavipes]